MASSFAKKKACVKCDKGAGTAMCHGCEQSFCTKHFIEHRQALSQILDIIGQEHDVLRKDLTTEQNIHPLLAHINRWEQESITKIQIAAEVARNDLQQVINSAKRNLEISVRNITDELHSSRESDDYTEIDIRKWTDQLQQLRKMLDASLKINIDYNPDTRSAIRLIKVGDYESSGSFDQTSSNLRTIVNERFVDVLGQIMLSERSLVATCLGKYDDWSCVDGKNWYSSGKHHIRFRIEQLGDSFCIFFGIINILEKITNEISDSTSCYGWWDVDSSVVSGELQTETSPSTNKTGDELTLILNCDNRLLQLRHHRTNRIVDTHVDLRLCAFPWKIVVVLRNENDCVRILH